MRDTSLVRTLIQRVTGSESLAEQDILAVEEPLEIRLRFGAAGTQTEKAISVTMRTPGNDEELATGFLYTEGIITNGAAVSAADHLPGSDDNVMAITLSPDVIPDMGKLDRHFYTTSSCGVCGKSSIDAVKIACNIASGKDTIAVDASLIYTLPALLRERQSVFDATGGLHASALFDTTGALLLLREDVGRHNALDKLIGAALKDEMLPLDHHILLLSGRASFELIQKAAMAGIKLVAAVGAPSSLAAKLAEENEMTLIGFLRDNRFNIYTGKQRIKA